ncbi:FABP family protein [Cellulosimicrobium marinum]|uniref:FABP family protein n=1 Tax=Cellulosimicrobium marinum TaxID=1638992 RepID=UPI001E469E12|nr:FABP family protein [Cellulosimicrobium marinum]MCB7136293.1 FABP family protein [Cellulosimicrobium marinum]
MAFEFPEGLAPEVYPLAWLVGSWRGEGVVKYPGVDETPFVQDVVFDHDGGPYLRYESTLRVLEAEVPATVPDEGEWPERAPDALDAAAQDGTVWSTETGYWRVSTDRPEGLGDDKHPLEVLLADPSGRVSVYLGAVGNGRVDLASDLIARTGTAAEISASKRLFGLVEGKLLWVWELAAFGEPLQSYASAKLSRRPAG